MFGRLFFPTRVNFALRQLSIDPRVFRQELKVALTAVGFADGRTPQEVAVWLAGQLPLPHRAMVSTDPIAMWLRLGAVNPAHPAMQEAFRELGWRV